MLLLSSIPATPPVEARACLPLGCITFSFNNTLYMFGKLGDQLLELGKCIVIPLVPATGFQLSSFRVMFIMMHR